VPKILPVYENTNAIAGAFSKGEGEEGESRRHQDEMHEHQAAARRERIRNCEMRDT
jgi:hypothetical protein